ncbi:MAG: copper chaperone PCu(A)C [Candidatus Sedimenticola sp. 20ELBAFRAG]
MERTALKLIATFILCVFSSTSVAAGVTTEDITATNFMVSATSGGQMDSAAYMHLENDCRCQDHALIAAYSPIADTVELHTHFKEDGVLKMRRIDEITIEANSVVVLQPGGPHVMLIGLKQAINVGDSVPLKLEFDDGNTIELIAPVRKIAMDDPSA